MKNTKKEKLPFDYYYVNQYNVEKLKHNERLEKFLAKQDKRQ